MDRLLEFAGNHTLLVFALVTSLMLVVFTELRRKATGMLAVGPTDAVKLINNDAAVLDMRSAELNFEVGVVVLDSPVAAEAVELLDERCRSGARVRREDLPQKAVARVVEGICRVLSPLL